MVQEEGSLRSQRSFRRIIKANVAMSEKDKGGQPITTGVALGFVLLVVYVLSVGPVAKLYPTTAPPAVRSFYAPLVFVLDQCPPARKLFLWYIHSVWGVPR
jgi:hypothetical protein